MPEFAIKSDALGKVYRLGTQLTRADTLRDRLVELSRGGRRRSGTESRSGHMWALKDVSFEVGVGEVVGVVGANGAGKTTLLKILSRITEPTEGRAQLRGRVGSLLEVGTGFHGELTGRENIFLSGAIMGMRRAEIRAKYDDIVEFSGVERFINTPVKRYSSGMYVRLAFAVAAFLEPEILLVDEVLAVGDAQFQKKCIGKMGSVAREGRTVLVVSHNMGVVNQLCSRALWLDGGQLRDDGNPAQISRAYLAEGGAASPSSTFAEDPQRDTQVVAARLLGLDGESQQRFSCDEPLVVEIDYLVRRRTPGLYGALNVNAADGSPVMISYTYDIDPNPMEDLDEGLHTLRVTIPPRTLAAGDYSLDFSVARGHKATVLLEQGLVLGGFALDDFATMKGNRRNGYFSTILDWSVSDRALTAETRSSARRQ
jgi:lipopolysaccharide transport system ATP-binding protein